MKHILTLTLSPTIDKSTSVEKIVAEHKLECNEPKFEPGGGGINVSRALKRLGLQSTAVFTSGGLSGKLLQELLEHEDIAQHPIETYHPTRENFIVVNRASNEQFRFGMPAPALIAGEEDKILKEVKQMAAKASYIVASGSIPKGVSADFLAKIARIAHQEDARLVVDTSGEALEQAIEEGIYLLKPNQSELRKLTGMEVDDNESLEEAARIIVNKGKCGIVVVSMGPQGAYAITKDQAEFVSAPSVKKRSTVGAGDSMVAGMVYGCVNNYDLGHIVRMGIACGSAATMNHGTELFKTADVDRLYEWLTK
ncbi:1-phosphofructokinase family hexose kinase [Mucilaginibacter sp. UR6-1]|uniref:1-phosphofructokinase family hexose kinase n=1 Tax=Mucilaginibacter sp. UR6-1 TaxID=1435643 RepID=UPI001E38A971|nr:1-phosphofructokinase family hexose kinase [Mucilaginibacter sp. UR6-1]MCC8409738.1 1-phosphofructokinase family hexose kinase [Mucilaginibacter sp. UR6-1]